MDTFCVILQVTSIAIVYQAKRKNTQIRLNALLVFIIPYNFNGNMMPTSQQQQHGNDGMMASAQCL